MGLREDGNKNSTIATDLLNDMVERGIKAGRLRLFVIDGSKALRCAIDAVHDSKNHVQRCRNHKIRNVLSYFPGEKKEEAKF